MKNAGTHRRTDAHTRKKSLGVGGWMGVSYVFCVVCSCVFCVWCVWCVVVVLLCDVVLFCVVVVVCCCVERGEGGRSN